tara:strand:+ start:308 stop:589 length:282 start_codon:yes stop_codon:yes gene_type:complete
MSPFKLAMLLAQVAKNLIGLGSTIWLELQPALADGHVTPAEAEVIARRASDAAGDVLDVRVNGVDIIGPAAQADAAAFLGRVIARAVAASDGQ